MNRMLERADFSRIPEAGALVVGFSGGADSVCLAHSLLNYVNKDRLVLAHINHMLRGAEAERDEAFAREFSRQYGLRFALFREDVRRLAQERRLGLEECGRQVRYAFLASLAPGEGDRILTAHNGDDNGETMVMNLCRGASLKGLSGIPGERGKILRPLLKVSREEIEKYCEENGLSYVVDSSNLSDDYTRNRLRHQVIPVLRELNPQWVRAVSRTARELGEVADYLSAQGKILLDSARRENASQILHRAPLWAAHPAVCKAALAEYARERGCGEMESRHVELLLQVLREGGAADLPGKRFCEAGQDWFWIHQRQEHKPFSVSISQEKTVLPNGKTLILEKKIGENWENHGKINNLLFKSSLDYDTMKGAFTARTRREGDCFVPAGRGVTKSLKQLFQENQVPASLRGDAVLLLCGNEIAYCEGVGVAQPFRVRESTKTLLQVHLLPGEANHGEG